MLYLSKKLEVLMNNIRFADDSVLLATSFETCKKFWIQLLKSIINESEAKRLTYKMAPHVRKNNHSYIRE